jgi:hypothetical protein
LALGSWLWYRGIAQVSGVTAAAIRLYPAA